MCKNNLDWDFLCERCGEPITEDDSNDYNGYCRRCFDIVNYEEIEECEE